MLDFFGVMLFKNFQSERRYWRHFLFECFIILIISAISLSNTMKEQPHFELYLNEEKYTHIFDAQTLKYSAQKWQDATGTHYSKYYLAFYPADSNVGGLLTPRLATNLGFIAVKVFNEFDQLTDSIYNNETLFGIYFQNDDTNSPSPPDLKYALVIPEVIQINTTSKTFEERRWMTKCTGMLYTQSNKNVNTKKVQKLFLSEGYMAVQELIFRGWYYSLLSEHDEYPLDNIYSVPNNFYAIYIVPFMHKDSRIICHYGSFSFFYHFLYNFMFLVPFCNIISKIAEELENNVMVTFYRYGVPCKVHWLAHFLTSFLHLLLLQLFFMFIVMIPWFRTRAIESFMNTRPEKLLVFFAFYNVALIFTAFAISFMFQKAKLCVLFGIVYWLFFLIWFFPFNKFDRELDEVPTALIMSLFFNNIVPYGVHYLKYHNFPEEKFYLLYIYLYQLAAILIAFLLFLLVWYLKSMPYFDQKPFNRQDPNAPDTKRKPNLNYLTVPTDFPGWQNFEHSATGLSPFLETKHIFTFSKNSIIPKLANISLKVYRDNLTVLFGHHGSGKTTLLKIFAGLKRPDYGSLFYDGKDRTESWRRSHIMADILFERNPIFHKLTVKENLEAFIFTKGVKYSKEEKDAELAKWLQLLRPYIPDGQCLVCKLSHMQQRFLALACIMCCKTKIILLDSPTTELELSDQLQFYEFLQKQKHGRSIVMTTYRADEAEAIADYIAVLNHGIILAYGSLYFFRSRLINEMQMIVIKRPNIKSKHITAFLKQRMALLEYDYEVGQTVMYKIPLSQRPKLAYLLIQVENAADSLGILTVHALNLEGSEVLNSIDMRHGKPREVLILRKQENANLRSISEKKVRFSQLKAMNYKKLMHRYLFILPFFALPLVLICIAIIRSLCQSLRFDGRVNLRDHQKVNIHVTHNDMQTLSDEFLTQKCNHYRLEPKQPLKSQSNYVFDEQSIRCVGESVESVFDAGKEHYSFGALEFRYQDDAHKFHIFIYVNVRNVYSGPALLNMFHNIMLKRTYGMTQNFTHSFSVMSGQISLDTKLRLRDYDLHGLILTLSVALLFPLIVSYFVIFLVEEKAKNLMTLLDIAGMSHSTYWLMTFLWDFLVYLILCIGVFLGICSMNIESFEFYTKLNALALLALYGINTLPCVYINSLFMNGSLRKAYVTCVLFFYLTGTMPYFIYWDITSKSSTVYWIFAILPGFAIFDGLSELYIHSSIAQLCRKMCEAPCEWNQICSYITECCIATNPYNWGSHGIGKSLVVILFTTSLYIWILIWIPIRRSVTKHSVHDFVKTYRTSYYDYFDPNVIKVKKDISKLDLTTCLQMTVVVDQLEKTLPRFRKRIQTVSFQVNRGECICIYGPCKTGKTHLASQLVGEVGFHFGEIYMVGIDFKQDLAKVRKVLGYCPQTDSLFRFLTVRQNLQMYCMVRKLPKEAWRNTIRELMILFNLQSYLSRYPTDVPYAIRRKVNMAIACIGSNEVIVIDEPTVGLPADHREDIWKSIRFLCRQGMAVILLTSDSLECKKCGNRVIIFDQYEMLSYDSLSNIRNYHSKGFIVETKITAEGATKKESDDFYSRDLRNLRRFIRFLDDNSVEMKHQHYYSKFYIPVANARYSYIYGVFEKNKRRLNLSEYFIHYATIEDILLKINTENAQKKAETDAYRRRQKILHEKMQAVMGKTV